MAYFQNQMTPPLYQWLYHSFHRTFPDELAKLVLLFLSGDPSGERVNRYGFLIEKPWFAGYVPLAAQHGQAQAQAHGQGGGGQNGSPPRTPPPQHQQQQQQLQPAPMMALPAAAPQPPAAAGALVPAAAAAAAAGGAAPAAAAPVAPVAAAAALPAVPLVVRVAPTPTPLSPILAPSDDTVRLALSRASSLEHHPLPPPPPPPIPAALMAAAVAGAAAGANGAAPPNAALQLQLAQAAAAAQAAEDFANGNSGVFRLGGMSTFGAEHLLRSANDAQLTPELRALARHRAAQLAERQQTADRKLRKRIGEWAPFIAVIRADDAASAPTPSSPTSTGSSSHSTSTSHSSSTGSNSELSPLSLDAPLKCGAKWADCYSANHSKIKKLVRKGIPNELRSVLWPKLLAAHTSASKLAHSVQHPLTPVEAKHQQPGAAATGKEQDKEKEKEKEREKEAAPDAVLRRAQSAASGTGAGLPMAAAPAPALVVAPALALDSKTPVSPSSASSTASQPLPPASASAGAAAGATAAPSNPLAQSVSSLSGTASSTASGADKEKDKSGWPSFYELLEQPCEADSCIRRSALRTFPDHVFFAEETGRTALEKLLHAYAVHDPQIGFSSGMSFPAALLLLYVDEPQAFHAFNALFQCHPYGLRDIYSVGLSGLLENLAILEALIAQVLPQLSAHLDREMVSVQFYAVSWFMTQFVSDLAFDAVIRVWDVLLNEGPKILFRVALALLQILQPELLRMPCETIMLTLKSQCRHVPAQQIMATAFSISLTSKQIEHARRAYRARPQPPVPRVPPPS